MHWLEIMTNLGDNAMLSLLVLVSSGYLIGCRSNKAAIALWLAFLLASAGIAFFKILFIGCGIHIADFVIHSPSGHVASSVAVYGTYALLINSQLHGWRKSITIIIATLLIAFIALSRVTLGFHNISEVIIGLITGSISLLLVRFFLHHGHKTSPFNIGILLILLLLTITLFYGIKMPAEFWIHYVAIHMRNYIPLCGS